ncbi:MAG: GH3 auxin-responsive promoter family protein, partial [Gemmatimonadaceae bacterium]
MNRTAVLRAIHGAYRASLWPARQRFERAAVACERTQEGRLRDLVAANANSAYGRAHRFASINSVRDWQDQIPIVHYEELEPWVKRAAAGEERVLTEAPVRIFERTSGSTAPTKLVPYTDALLSEFGAATGPWLQDLYTSIPALRGTRSYWSISPATRGREHTAGGTPIGFEDDTEYFSPFARVAIRMMLAVPPNVARIVDIADWRRATVRHLAGAEDLGLISVWHPSFLTLLLRDIAARLDEVLAELPRTRAQSIKSRLDRHTLGEALWPRLAVVSCWADGPAKDAIATLQAELPHARVQPKGLLATEGVVSIPLMEGEVSRSVAAITSHFLEFADIEHPSSRPLLAHELQVGATYAPIISTGGGFYRYRLGDAVRCYGRYQQAPLLRFMGRIDQVSDLCGEKLNAVQVGA